MKHKEETLIINLFFILHLFHFCRAIRETRAVSSADWWSNARVPSHGTGNPPSRYCHSARHLRVWRLRSRTSWCGTRSLLSWREGRMVEGASWYRPGRIALSALGSFRWSPWTTLVTVAELYPLRTKQNIVLEPCHTRQHLEATWRQPIAVHATGPLR